MESWKLVEEIDGEFYISNYGRFKSVNRTIIRKNGRKQTFKGKIYKGSRDSSGYSQVSVKGKSYTIHVLVMRYFKGYKYKKGYEIDHIDNNKDNNNLSNLQILTKRQNISKAQKRISLYSKYTGVTKDKRDGRWVSLIAKNKINIYLGRFDCELAAAYAYNKALKSL